MHKGLSRGRQSADYSFGSLSMIVSHRRRI